MPVSFNQTFLRSSCQKCWRTCSLSWCFTLPNHTASKPHCWRVFSWECCHAQSSLSCWCGFASGGTFSWNPCIRMTCGLSFWWSSFWTSPSTHQCLKASGSSRSQGGNWIVASSTAFLFAWATSLPSSTSRSSSCGSFGPNRNEEGLTDSQGTCIGFGLPPTASQR